MKEELIVFQYTQQTRYIKDDLLDDDWYHIDLELKWDALKFDIETCNHEDMQRIINENTNDLSLLINFINYTEEKSIIQFNYIIEDWIKEYIEWYDKEGKKDMKNIKYAIETFRQYDIETYYDNKIEEDKIKYDCVIAKCGDSKKQLYTVEKIKVLIYQLYYKLVQIMINNKDINKEQILEYLEKARDYKDAKELKHKLFFEYLGYEMGQEPDIELDDKGIVMVYKMAKLIRK